MKLKNILIGLFAFVLLFIVTYNGSIKVVNADSGFDSSYDSGGGGSSSSWSSSSSSWSSSSSSWSSSSSGVSIADTVFYLCWAVILVIILLRSKHDSTISLDHSHEANLDKLLELIPDFNKEKFLHDRCQDYIDIQNAWTNFDYDILRSKLTDELYNQYEMQLETLKAKNQVNQMSDFSIIDSMITSVNIENDKVTLTYEVIASFYDYITQDGNVVRGNSKRKITMHYAMTSVMSLTNKVETCPNCGAKLEDNASNVCSYCNSKVSAVTDKWVLSKKEAKAQG